MRKVASVFVVAVFVPSLLLAWLAVRSIRDQQFVLERQQSLLHQQVADGLAQATVEYLAQMQREFAGRVESLLAAHPADELVQSFDEELRKAWPLAAVAFAVSLEGKVFSPSLFGGAEARKFRLENDLFLCNRESVEVYWNGPKGAVNLSALDKNSPAQNEGTAPIGKNQLRNVVPQQAQVQPPQQQGQSVPSAMQQVSKLAPSEAEFRQLVGESQEGTIARFLQNRLNLLFWYRSSRDWQIVYGSEIELAKLTEGLRGVIRIDPPLRDEICLALLDDTGRPVVRTSETFAGDWKRPFVATEIGETLPHWEVAVYLLNPAKLSEAARTLKSLLGLLVAVLLFAIGVGSWLIVRDLNRQLLLTRQKADFVSNVSHELKTPLTSIRMFSELLAEGRVANAEKQRGYLEIISVEAARLTRLINNVLDFARLERGENEYDLRLTDLCDVVRRTIGSYRPHLEASGFHLSAVVEDGPLTVRGDPDALEQIVVNLLSNAEKYSGGAKEVAVEVTADGEFATVAVLDRGPGVPAGLEARIFEQFYRAHDALTQNVAGSGLGLTLARQIAQTHGGDIEYRPRPGGGSCFTLRVPLADRGAALLTEGQPLETTG